MAQLIVIKGPDLGQKFELAEAAVIGHGEDCTLKLEDGKVGPAHARIERTDEGFSLSGMQDQTPVQVNGHQIWHALLQHGDLIELGQTLLLFDDQAAGTSAARPSGEGGDSQIQSRKRHYDSVERVIASVGELDRPQQRLATLYKIAHAISGILELEPLAAKILEILFDEFQPDRGYIVMVDHGKLKPIATRFASGTEATSETPRISRTIIKEVFASKDSILATDAQSDERFRAGESIMVHQIQSAMCAPLIYDNEILGIIHLDSKHRGAYTEKDLDQLTQISMQAALVIQNARVVSRNQTFSRHLLALGRATQGLNAYLEHQRIVEETVSFACRIFGCSKGSMFLMRPEGGLRLAHAIGIEPELWGEIEVTAGQGVVGWVAQHDRPLLVGAEGEELPAEIRHQPARTYDTTSFLVVPLAGRGGGEHAAGVICVTDKLSREPFSVEDRELLGILASHSSIALTNARLIDELRAHEAEIQRWNRELEQRVEERTAELKAAQDQLIQSEKMAAVGLLAAGVSHEFNNLITSMYGFAQLAKSEPKFAQRLVDVVLAQSERGKQITEGLLSFSRSGDDIFDEIELPKLIDSVVMMVDEALTSESIQIVRTYDPVPPVVGVMAKLRSVFLKLLTNARDAIQGEGTIEIQVGNHDSGGVQVSFIDSGSGVPEEDLPRLFEPFFTTKGSFGGSKTPGHGIGLSICYNIICEHGGDIRVRSTLGKGTTFHIVLPLEHARASQAGRIQLTRRIDRGQRILLVEDSESVREVLINLLKSRSYSVSATASSAEEALEVCASRPIDWVFLNVKLPGEMNGYDALGALRTLNPELKVILLTSDVDDVTFKAHVDQSDGFLRKPVNPKDLDVLLRPIE